MELTISQVIKIIIGVLVFVVVVVGVYYFFRNYLLNFFENMVPGDTTKFVLFLLK